MKRKVNEPSKQRAMETRDLTQFPQIRGTSMRPNDITNGVQKMQKLTNTFRCTHNNKRNKPHKTSYHSLGLQLQRIAGNNAGTQLIYDPKQRPRMPFYITIDVPLNAIESCSKEMNVNLLDCSPIAASLTTQLKFIV